MGFYPVNPVSGQYVFGAPQMKKITVHLQNGKTFTVIADGLSEANKYVESITLNGKKLSKNYIDHAATETTREPGINNISVNTDVDKGVRFATETYNHDYTDSEGTPVKRKHNEYEFYKIKKYSLLARGGMEYKDYKALVESDALTAEDMANVTRTFQGNDFIDIGARAIGELVLPVATAAL